MSDARGLPNHVGSNAARAALSRWCRPIDAIADLPAEGDNGMMAWAKDGSLWRYDAASTLTADGILVVGTATAGRWLRAAGQHAMLEAAATFATTDGATLMTVPTGCILKPIKAWWKVATAWTGGSSAAIGVDSDNASLNTAGDILGGASGDVLAGLTVGEARGTDGAAIAAPGAILEAGDVVRFQRITDAFTAGAATLRLLAFIIENAGA